MQQRIIRGDKVNIPTHIFFINISRHILRKRKRKFPINVRYSKMLISKRSSDRLYLFFFLCFFFFFLYFFFFFFFCTYAHTFILFRTIWRQFRVFYEVLQLLLIHYLSTRRKHFRIRLISSTFITYGVSHEKQ